jgi:hypothetical protein
VHKFPYTGCGKLTAFFKGKLQYEKRSELAAPCIYRSSPRAGTTLEEVNISGEKFVYAC